MENISYFKSLCREKFELDRCEEIEKAIEIAIVELEPYKREDGSPFFNHSIGTAEIAIKELNMGATSVIAALLHDIVRRNPNKIDEYREQFSEKVKDTLLGMNNISLVETNNNAAQIEHFKDLIVSYSINPRIILLKLADRLEVMQNLEHFPLQKQEKKAWESLHIYSQIAHKLGLYSIKSKLEDLAIRYLEPQLYQHIVDKLKADAEIQATFIDKFCEPIKKKLELHGVNFVIKGRTKSIYSIWKKMHKQKITFEEVYDLSATRIIIDTPPETEKAMCWLCFSIVTDFYKPNPKRMRDWISIPKSNGYESLHTTVITKEGKWVEVQIRTKRMDEMAEYGMAAHWRYKGVTAGGGAWYDKLREVIETVNIEGNNQAFDNNIDNSTKEVFVFTPSGDLRKLSKGATILDFAYDIHSDIGNKCIGGKVNSKNVTIRQELQNGDLVEIKTGKNQIPKIDWLNYVVTSKAKSRIKAYLREQSVKETEEIKDELERKIKNWKINISLDEAINTLCKYFKVKNGSELYKQIESEDISMLEAKELLTKYVDGELALRVTEERTIKTTTKPTTSNDEVLLIGSDLTNIKYNFAKCCNPIFGDDIKGFITVLNGITIHQSNCVNFINLAKRYPYRIVEAQWSKSERKGMYIAKIGVNFEDILGFENDVKEIAIDLNITLRDIKTVEKAKSHYSEIQVEVPNQNVLNSMIYLIKTMRNVSKVNTI